MCLILQGTRVQVQVLKSCKSIQKSSAEVMFIKARQIAWQMYLSRFKIWSSTDISIAVSIENYEIQIFRFVFHTYPSYVFGFSFLTTLDLYKDYFNGNHKVVALVVTCILWTETICLSSSFFWRNCCVCTPLGFVTKKLLDLHRVDELKNFTANILFKLVC